MADTQNKFEFTNIAYHELRSLKPGDILRVVEVSYNDHNHCVAVTFEQIVAPSSSPTQHRQ